VIDTPARYWRAVVRSGLFRFVGDDEALHAFLREQYAGLPPGDPDIGRFVLGVGLLSFGHLDVVDDVLDGIPAADHPSRMLARSVDGLIPGAGGNVLVDAQAVRDWIAQHRDRLVWNEESGVFELLSPD
jgi:hypothetical protein